MTLNASKTKYILFKNKKEDVSITSLKLQIDYKDIEREELDVKMNLLSL